MANFNDLPPELFVEICSRLPSKSVGKCRCVSKTWNSNLSTSQFIKLHLTRKPHQENLLLITHSKTLLTITPPFENSRKLELGDTWCRVVGSCNGIVLLINEEAKVDKLCLLNPLTMEKVNIPGSGDVAYDVFKTYGFGYDSVSDDYKIVAIPVFGPSSYVMKPGYVMKPDDEFVDVYSVKKGVWNRVTNRYAAVDTGFCSGYFLNGAAHFLARTRGRYIIAAFDFASEVFHEIPTPVFKTRSLVELCVLRERLCLVSLPWRDGETTDDIWTMEKYGSVESWKKLAATVNRSNMRIHRPLCFVKDDEVVIKTIYKQNWVVYNVKRGRAKKFVVGGVSYDFSEGGTFSDSLVSLG